MKTIKKSILLFCVFLVSNNNLLLSVEKFTVVKVLGTIIIKKTGALLAQGDILLSNEPILFKTADSKASVISNEKGRFILSAGNSESSASNVKSCLLPPMGNISSRAGAILNLNDLKTNFSGNYLILKQGEFPISKSAFPMDESSFFYLSYQYKNESINKKLTHRGDTLLIVTNDLFLVDGKPIAYAESTMVKLNYLKDKKPLFVSEFNILSPNNDQLVNEVKIILDGSKNKSYQDIVNDVVSYFTEFYGKTDEDNVKIWLKENFSLQP